MNQEAFSNWFKLCFVPEFKEYLCKNSLTAETMLLMDNVTTHPIEELRSEDSKITCTFLSPNTMSLIQPMKPIESFKRCYRKTYQRPCFQVRCRSEKLLENIIGLLVSPPLS